MMAAKSVFGLKSSSIRLEKQITGCSFSENLMPYTGFFPSESIRTSKPVFAKVEATMGNRAVASVPPE